MNTNTETKNIDTDDVVYVDSELSDLVPGFLENRRKDVSALRDAINSNEASAVRSIGHSLKGVGGSYGFKQLSLWGAQIEDFGKMSDVNSVRPILEQMDMHLQNLKVVYFKS